MAKARPRLRLMKKKRPAEKAVPPEVPIASAAYWDAKRGRRKK